MRVEDLDKTYLSIKDEYGNIINQPILVVAKTGGGKGLVLEILAEDYHNNDCVVIAIADPKQNCELAFSMFPPEEKYHLRNLKVINKKPQSKNVQLYHPFILGLNTKEYLPNYNFYTIPIKDLGDGEFSLLAETHSKSEAVSILESASDKMGNEDGFYSFADKLRQVVEKQKEKNKKKGLKDFSFLGDESGIGTKKDLGKIKGYLNQFEQFGFLSKKNYKYNLDWEKILTDQEHYHIFVTNFIDRTHYKKIIGFIVLNLIQSIIRNKKLLKKHLVILIPEIKNLVKFKPDGFEQFLGDAMTEAISTVRSEGISIVGDTQVRQDIDRRTLDVFKVNLLGELTGNDIDDVHKKYGFIGREYKEFLRKPPKNNTFVMAESDTFQPFTFFLPSAMHKEPIPGKYNFENMYKRYSRKNPEVYPLKNYKDLVKEIREDINLEKKKYLELEKQRFNAEELEESKKQEQKISKDKSKDRNEDKEEKTKEKEKKTSQAIEKLCYEMYNNPEENNLKVKKNGKASAREISKKLTEMGFENVKTHASIMKNIRKYEEKLKQEYSMDYEERFEKMKEENKDLD